MNFSFLHANLNVLDLERSIAFYRDALSLQETRRIKSEAGSFELVFLADCNGKELLELTWLADKKEPYLLGDNESHLAFGVHEFDKAKALHEEMGIICFDNADMGIYFIEDPDGYWIEIIPNK